MERDGLLLLVEGGHPLSSDCGLEDVGEEASGEHGLDQLDVVGVGVGGAHGAFALLVRQGAHLHEKCPPS